MKISAQVSIRSALLAAIGAIAVLALILLVQDARHGWPFSRHHQAVAPAAAAAPAKQLPAGSSAGAARTTVALDAMQFERLGVRFEPARRAPIEIGSRAVATVAADERRMSHVHTRVSGWVEQLYVNTTGEAVRAGQPLAAVFSQELFASQTEYLAALKQQRETPGSAVLGAARTRLAVLGMTDREIAALERSDTPRRLVTLVAPRAGVVLRRGVTVGTAVDPSTELLTIADLSRVWVLAELPEAEAAAVRVGTRATLSFPGAARPPFAAAVEFVYPTLAERTRAVRVRFTVANEDGALRPGLYGTASFAAVSREALTVARDAVVDTGASQHVFVRTGSATLEPRPVRLGASFDERIEVLEGLEPGEQVVTAGVFLIDSESRLRASGGAGHAGHGAAAPAKAVQEPHGEPSSSEVPSAVDHSAHGS